MFTNPFHKMSASVLGRRHLALGLPNQDAVLVAEGWDGLVGIVSDGCSGSPNSQIGAVLQVRFLCRVLLEGLSSGLRGAELLETARLRQEEMFRGVSAALGESVEVLVPEMFYATVVGVVVTTETTLIFRRGDGVILINDEDPILVDEGNKPHYPAYSLLNSGLEDHTFHICREMPTDEVTQVLIGTDGMDRFVRDPTRPDFAGRPIGEIRQFFHPIFQDDEGVLGQKRLSACGPYAGWQKSPLDDDTSFIRLQRCAPS